jgi:DNA-binding beta-propeller fold protein YncE
MAIRSDGRLMAVCNFNTNSISFYDLTLGRVGTAIYELPLYAENPHALTFSPDGNSLIVATYTGEIDGLSSHTLLYIIDTDPSSPTYLRTRTRIKNR